MKISEVGLKRRQIKRWTVKKPKCMTTILSASSLDIYEFAPHLILLCAGMTFAFVVHLFEIIISRFDTSNVFSMTTLKKLPKSLLDSTTESIDWIQLLQDKIKKKNY